MMEKLATKRRIVDVEYRASAIYWAEMIIVMSQVRFSHAFRPSENLPFRKVIEHIKNSFTSCPYTIDILYNEKSYINRCFIC